MQSKNDEIYTIADTEVIFEISKSNEYNQKDLVILHKDGFSKYLEVNPMTLSVLYQLNSQKTFHEIFNQLIIDFKLSGSVDEIFVDFKQTALFKYLFDTSSDFKATRGDKYIFPKLTILKKEWVRICHLLSLFCLMIKYF